MKTIKGYLEKSKTNPMPDIDVYLPKKSNKKSTALIIFPGGAYAKLAEHEGKGYADYFSKNGIACFVVKYRLCVDGFKHPAMLEDAKSAINAIRKKADEYNIDKDKVGVMGSSAGGHLAAHLLTSYENLTLKPNFGVLCYPVILVKGKFISPNSIKNLIGIKKPEKLLKEVSIIDKITKTTSPMFIWHTVEDGAVDVVNSMELSSALRKKNVKFEMHLYQRGGHGLGLNTKFDWGKEALRWINEIA